MNHHRRNLVQFTAIFTLMASAGLITEAQAEEWNKAAFEGKSLDEVFKALGSTSTPEKSSLISMNAPDIAENGAVVPVSISSNLKAQQIAILVEKNPSTLAAQFFVSTRIKMAQTSTVFGLVKVDGKWLMTSKEIKVTLGGCGG